MSIVTAVVLSMLLLTVTGCATSSPPSRREAGDGQESFHQESHQTRSGEVDE